MFSRIQRLETVFFGILRRQPSGMVERGGFRLFFCSGIFLLLSFVPGGVGDLSSVLAVFSIAALAVFLLILMYRWFFRRVLWTVRNRLIVTCLLMGLAPVILLDTLVAIVAYIFSGQFATNTALAALSKSTDHVQDVSAAFAAPIEHALELHPGAKLVTLPESAQTSPAVTSQQGFVIAAWRDGVPVKLMRGVVPGTQGTTPHQPFATSLLLDTPLPAWVYPGFSGVVQEHGQLYTRAVSGYTTHGHTMVVLASVPLGHNSLNALGQGLGIVKILPRFSGHTRLSVDAEKYGGKNIVAASNRESNENGMADFASVQGGTLMEAAHFYDTLVVFTAPLHFTDWTTGKSVQAMIGVVSRPTLLYQRLFATSVLIGVIVRDGLITITALFVLLELIAFFMAVRLSRTITRSVADLYGATKEIDHGNFAHRIQVSGERSDQLTALATSFNAMSGSLENLLEQQREKERIQSELAIAQEVQNNLFPHTPIHLPGFEMHGICKPARMVSGDYYDFILAGENQLCLALGDISGKGISAALLMASLHAAVRAYRFAGEALNPQSGSALSETGVPVSTFASPGKLLALLNRHLYSSTQPAKYATLFFACYNSTTQKLTYSNGGQLPPLVLCADGSVKRLDCGGTVVGLLDGMEYEEATISLARGDLLVAYSDGVTEPENDFGDFGENRLVEVIRREQHQPLATISKETMHALRTWIGNAEQPDDITLVLARRL